MSKRKRDPPDDPAPTPPLRTIAYEADLVHDRPNLAVEKRGPGGGLIQWDDEWVDRFDARLLLSPSDLTIQPPSPSPDPTGDTGWTDLPSDSEDTFFLTPNQIAEYRHEKQMKDMERGRLDRLKALAEREAVENPDVGYQQAREDEEDTWGGSDEEPDDAQLDLMTRTATHILASPNPVQLEMRILANHGANPKFAFLRGRWKRAWVRLKSGGGAGENDRMGDGNGRNTGGEGGKKTSGGIGGLGEYESESEGESEEEGKEGETSRVPDDAPPPMSSHNADDDEGDEARVKAERRARAQEWMRRRRQERELAPSA